MRKVDQCIDDCTSNKWQISKAETFLRFELVFDAARTGLFVKAAETVKIERDAIFTHSHNDLVNWDTFNKWA